MLLKRFHAPKIAIALNTVMHLSEFWKIMCLTESLICGLRSKFKISNAAVNMKKVATCKCGLTA